MMKTRLVLLGLVCLAACSKNNDQQATQTEKQDTEPQSCDFGITEFNQTKRPQVNEDVASGSGNWIITVPNAGTTPSAAVLLLDFNGHTLTGTGWNYSNASFACAPANLTAVEIEKIIKRVANDYSPFTVIVTTNESIYNATTATRRMRIVITESWEWYGQQVGGIAYVGSFHSGNNTPAFVFSSLLNYNSKKIAEATSHEAGHTFGLHHQALYTSTCTKTTSYHWGAGSGELGWAPIMGISYAQNLSLWHNGSTSQGCNVMQNDIVKLSSVIGLKGDDYPNAITPGAVLISGTRSGIMNASNDIDVFLLSIGSAKTIKLAPENVGGANDGGNLDLVLKVYNALGTLINTIDNPASLSVSKQLPAGAYYISVSNTSNANTSTYGMLGQYTITVN
jgi:hypothetical protein